MFSTIRIAGMNHKQQDIVSHRVTKIYSLFIQKIVLNDLEHFDVCLSLAFNQEKIIIYYISLIHLE